MWVAATLPEFSEWTLPVLNFHLVQAFGTTKGFVYFITK